MFSMSSIGPSSFGDPNQLRYSALANKQYSQQMGGLLAGLPQPKISGPLSADFLNQVYDSKALTPQVLSNYLNKANDVFAEDSGQLENMGSKQRAEYESFVDKMLAQKQAEMDQEKQNLISPSSDSSGIDVIA